MIFDSVSRAARSNFRRPNTPHPPRRGLVLEFKSVRTEGRRVPSLKHRAPAKLANSVGESLILRVDDVTREPQGIPLPQYRLVGESEHRLLVWASR